MTALPPPIVREDLLERARGHVRQRLGVADDAPVPADGLIRIFAALAEIVAARIDGALEKNRLAFLDLVGVRQAPPRAARVPLTFTAAQGAPWAVRVPAGTTAAAQPGPGESDPVSYQTEQELTVAPAALATVWAREPGRDRIADLTMDVAGPSGSVARDPFAGAQVPERRLLLGCGHLLAMAPRQTVTIKPALAGGDLKWLAALSWAWWDGSAWQPLIPTRPSAQTVALDVPEVPEAELGGIRDRWLSARLDTSVPNAGLAWDAGRKVQTVRFSGPPDAAYADDTPLDIAAPFAPFGPAATAGEFWLAADDAFGKPGAAVTLSVVPAEGAGGAGEPPPVLAWEYTNGRTWKELAGVVDTTVGLTSAGQIRFAVPDDWARSLVGDRTALWLRARLRQGAWVGAPRLASITVGTLWALPRISYVPVAAATSSASPGLPPDAVLAGGVPVDPTADFKPFGERPAAGATCHMACDEAVVPPPHGVISRVSIAITVTPRSGAAPPAPSAALAWEYWDGNARAWVALGGNDALQDSTAALTTNGTVSFDVPAALASETVAGDLHRWIRVRIKSGDYGKEATYVPATGSPGFTLQQATLAPPSIASLRFWYDRASGSDRFAKLLVRSDAGLHAAPEGPFEPFPPMLTPDAALHLGFGAPLPNAALTLYADVEQEAGDSGRLLAPSVAWEHWDGKRWERLAVRDETAGFTRSGTVTFVAPAGLSPHEDFGITAWWLRARRQPGPPSARGRVRALLTNTTWAVEGTGIVDETLGSSTGEPGLRLTSTRTPVLDGETLWVLEPDVPPAAERAAMSADAIGSPEAAGVWIRWARVTDFVTSGPRDRHYTLDPVTGVVEFGDGRRGLIPPLARAGVRMRYRAGGGARGNRAAGEITELKTAVAYIEAVTNHIAATGGADVESLASVGERGPRMLRHRGRAVAAIDVEDLAVDAAPAVARTLAIPATRAENAGQVGLVVVPHGLGARPEPGAALLAAARADLEARLPATADVWVTGPGWVQVTVSATLTATSLDAAAQVQGAAVARLTEFLHPLTGGPSGTGWPFGRAPHESDLVAVLEALPGVEHVEHLSLARTELEPGPAPDAFLITSGPHAVTMVGG